MAHIRPFIAIRPDSKYAGRLLFPQKEEEEYGLKSRLERMSDQTETGNECWEKLYEEINNTLFDLMEGGFLVAESQTGIYVYEYCAGKCCSRGIWTLTAVDDYRNGMIKVHEHTFTDNIKRLQCYRKLAKMEGAPVLLTYYKQASIDKMINAATAGSPLIAVDNGEESHKLWKIEEPDLIAHLIRDFSAIKEVYLADGHHRMEAALNLSAGHRHQEDYISTLYVPSDELLCNGYYRAVIPERSFDLEELVDVLEKYFVIIPSPHNEPVEPKRRFLLGMCHNRQWYRLLLRTEYQLPDAEKRLDAELLQDMVLAEIFGITNPQDDSRLKCIGGKNAMRELRQLLDTECDAVGFTLCPLSVGQIIEAADQGRVLPPKVSWINPKVPFGLLLYHHEINQTTVNEHKKNFSYRCSGTIGHGTYSGAD